MSSSLPIDHPAGGAVHVFLPGNADSVVAAAAFVRRSEFPGWVTLAREHRLPVLLERPLSQVASGLWCIGYSGTGNPLLPSALEVHAAHRPVWWLTATTGRLESFETEVPGVRFHNLPGGSLIPQVMSLQGGEWTEQDREYERLGYLLGRYSGTQPTDAERLLVNRLHAASVQVRNQERSGAALVRELSDTPLSDWMASTLLSDLAAGGENRIRRSRRFLNDVEPVLGRPTGPAVWIVKSGRIDRGAHGKALATRCHARRAPVVLIEETKRGPWTKAWVVLPPHKLELWPWIMHEAARFSGDFSYTGLRGAGAIPAGQEGAFATAIWPVLTGE